jgi:tetratricopeptide (TPR) repeat protein
LLAYQILEPALKSEPSNPFILNEAARAAYWVDSLIHKSYNLYNELIAILDEEGLDAENDESVYINIWFTEAYWKIGALHLDFENYSDSIFEIQRALVTMYDRGSPQVFEQFYSFLSKAYFKVGKLSEAQCFADNTLKLNPNNEFVRPYTQNYE